ncbi:MAG: acyl-CoA dehydrogenase family protein [Deltaproteobacteria bacterium]|jgi:alkylation response protein AidB-like acyl-CoA dehydrogenase|nr:acyl-CoA dehydrogenase family protein [Deltaproteobacteria bacterium]
MDFSFTEKEEAFRNEVREFLAEHHDSEGVRADGADIESAMDKLPKLLAWNQALYEKGWVGFSWPREFGGSGGGIVEQMILKQECGDARAPILGLSYMGLAWVGPGIIQYGTDAQKKRFIPPILKAEEHWCTGYSEPGSGSDLASLQCRAERDGDDYVINGQKIWTSLAMWAQWMILLVRTDPTASKHLGISCLLVPMDSEGLEVRPIKAMNGETPFAEVFFDNVRVPVENRLGAEGQGWDVTKHALANERSSIAEVTALHHNLDDLKSMAGECRLNGKPAIEDAGIRQRLARMQSTIEAMRLNGLRFLTKQLRGEPIGAETSVNKLLRTEMDVETGRLACDMQGGHGVLTGKSPGAVQGGRWQKNSLSWPTTVIGGGTPNIQRNVIAERLLGLPHDS